MAFKTLLVALAAVAPLALAETFEVTVGAGGEFAFEPTSVEAVAGDIINFSFYPKSHTVTQSTFDTPCAPLAGGFATEVIATTAEGETQQAYTLPADYDGSPQWFHCAVAVHCSQGGMVFAINPPTEGNRTFEAFQAAATGGEAPPASPTGGNSTQNPPSASNSSTSPNPSASAPAGDDGAASSLVAQTGLVAVVAGLVASVVAL